MQKNNAFNKFYFYPNFFSYRLLHTFKNGAILINHEYFFLGKRFSTTWAFPIFEYKFLNGWNYAKTISQDNIFIKKLQYLIIIYSISKIGNGQVVENLFPKKINRDLLESHHF